MFLKIYLFERQSWREGEILHLLVLAHSWRWTSRRSQKSLGSWAAHSPRGANCSFISYYSGRAVKRAGGREEGRESEPWLRGASPWGDSPCVLGQTTGLPRLPFPQLKPRNIAILQGGSIDTEWIPPSPSTLQASTPHNHPSICLWPSSGCGTGM